MLKTVVINKEIKGGKPVLKGTRFPVSRLLLEIAKGNSSEGIASEYGLDVYDINGFFEELSDSIDKLLEDSCGK